MIFHQRMRYRMSNVWCNYPVGRAKHNISEQNISMPIVTIRYFLASTFCRLDSSRRFSLRVSQIQVYVTHPHCTQELKFTITEINWKVICALLQGVRQNLRQLSKHCIKSHGAHLERVIFKKWSTDTKLQWLCLHPLKFSFIFLSALS